MLIMLLLAAAVPGHGLAFHTHHYRLRQRLSLHQTLPCCTLKGCRKSCARRKESNLQRGWHPSCLSAVGSSAWTGRAAIGLVSSAAMGSVWENVMGHSGILVTLLTSGVLSNVGLVPSSHVLYDLCWTRFLPASLALLLLTPLKLGTDKDEAAPARDTWDMAIPFCLASFGSIVGCLVAFLVCQSWFDTPYAAAVAAGCLCASYIGGSVNFFATAHVLSSSPNSSGNMSSLFGSMATADLIVMALYFLILAAAAESSMLDSWFPQRGQPSINNLTLAESATTSIKITNDYSPSATSPLGRTVATAGLIAVAAMIEEVSNVLERELSQRVVPGLGCASIAILATSIRRLLQKPSEPYASHLQNVAPFLSSFCFHLFFASIGMSANLGQALRQGPLCLLFATLALFLHMAIAFSGSVLFHGWFRRLSYRWEHVLVASNAAIGGPSTAAAFAATLGLGKPGLVLAATVWGAVGYATGTGIGVALTRCLFLSTTTS